jgi:DNA end-binding protein Ku
MSAKTSLDGSPKMPHHVWHGAITLGGANFPLNIAVLLFTAAREDNIEFHHYHAGCLSRAKQLGYFCPNCSGADTPASLDPEATIGEVILGDDLIKGYECADGQIVQVTKEELEDIEPESARVLEITEFCAVEDVPPLYFDSNFYLSPDTKAGAQRGYAILRAIMLKKKVVAIAKITKSQRENIAIIAPYGDGMVLYRARFSYEVRPMVFPEQPTPTAAEMKVAGDLVDAMTEDWEPAKYVNTYRINLTAMLEAKRLKKEPPKVEKRPPAGVTADYMSAFAATLEMVKQQKRKKAKAA